MEVCTTFISSESDQSAQVLYSLADESINEQVVIDSTSAINYESWQSNAYGSGFDVSLHESTVKILF